MIIGDVPSLTAQLLKEGHEIVLYSKNFEETSNLYQGINRMKVVNDIKNVSLSNIDFAIFGGSDKDEFNIAARLSRQIPGLLASKEAAQLELNREIGKKVASMLNINIPRYSQMRISEAINYVKTRRKPQVIKPVGNQPPFTTTICNTVDDTIFALNKLKKIIGDAIVEIEDRIFGTEIGVESFFNGRTFMKPINISFEHKAPYDGDMGPLGPEAGTLMYYEFPSRLYLETLYKMEPLLQQLNYHGDFAMGMILEYETNKLYFLEYTVRFGYPEILIQCSAMKNMSLTELFLKMLDPNEEFLDIEDLFFNGICYQIGGSPLRFATERVGEGHLINYKNKPLTINDLFNPPENTYFLDINRSDDYLITGSGLTALVITGSGITAAEAIINSYININNYSIVYGFYRTDIGRKMVEEGCKHIYEAGYMDEYRFRRFYQPQLDIRTILKTVEEVF